MLRQLPRLPQDMATLLLLLLQLSSVPDPHLQSGHPPVLRPVHRPAEPGFPPDQSQHLKRDPGGFENKRLRVGPPVGHHQGQCIHEHQGHGLLPRHQPLQTGLQTQKRLRKDPLVHQGNVLLRHEVGHWLEHLPGTPRAQGQNRRATRIIR